MARVNLKTHFNSISHMGYQIPSKNWKNLKGEKGGAHQNWGKIIFRPYGRVIGSDLSATKMNSTARKMAEISTKNR